MQILNVYFGFSTIIYAYENVALNKTAFHTSALNEGKYDPRNAVDGLKSDLSRDGGECTATTYSKQTATWWVHLKDMHFVNHITIYFMTENKTLGPSNYLTKYFLGFSVYVSNTTERLQGTLCYKDNNFTLNTIPAVFTTTCPVHGQYVIYYNERLPGVAYPGEYSTDAHADLCEVEVYACLEGYFGNNCTMKCNETCSGCSYSNEFCDTECLSDWRGKPCERTSTVDTEQTWKSEFYGILGAFCILVIENGILVGYIVVKRIKKPSEVHP